MPYLGKISLFWCEKCNLPLLDKISCHLCGSQGRSVAISPPGDIRPAFWKDFLILQNTIDREYGINVGSILFSSNKVILLNRIGGLDKTEEIIMDGQVIGILQFDILIQSFKFLPRLVGAQYITIIQEYLKIPNSKRIYIKKDSLSFLFEGKSVLAPGTDAISKDIKKDDYALIIIKYDLTQEFNVPICVAVGIARENFIEGSRLIQENHGMIAKNKFHVQSKEEMDAIIILRENLIENFKINETFLQTKFSESEVHQQILTNLEHVYQANHQFIQSKIKKSHAFIKKTIEENNYPIAVAYSGGKDSLGVLLLVFQLLGPNFKIFFANTGLELPEVLQNVHNVSKILKMEDKLVIKNAGDTFWEIVETFGPPGRDYRFCCHSLKAQQITEIINTLYNGEQVLSFLGQRQYESLSRSQSKLVYINSFIPLQIAATPIKDWNALLLWLFILFEPIFSPQSQEKLNIPITPLYFAGHERLGCYLCPAANLASFNLLKESHPDMHSRWFSFLNNYAIKYSLPTEWVKLGLWRFKQLSPQWKNLLDELNLPIQFSLVDSNTSIDFQVTKGFSPCLQSGYSIKGKFSHPIDLEILSFFMVALSNQIDYDSDLNVLTIRSEQKHESYRLNIFSDGSLFLLSSKQTFDYAGALKMIVGTVIRSLKCNQCKTCVSICPQNAITLENSIISISSQKCTQCKTCITHCPLFQIGKSLLHDLNI